MWEENWFDVQTNGCSVHTRASHRLVARLASSGGVVFKIWDFMCENWPHSRHFGHFILAVFGQHKNSSIARTHHRKATGLSWLKLGPYTIADHSGAYSLVTWPDKKSFRIKCDLRNLGNFHVRDALARMHGCRKSFTTQIRDLTTWANIYQVLKGTI